MNSPHAIETQYLTISYQRDVAVEELNLAIPLGAFVGIIGPNGAGKTSLLKAILGLLPHYSGRILIWGKEGKKERKRLCYVPQRNRVDWDFPLTVFDVVLMGRYGHLGWFKRPQKEDREIAMEALCQVKMEALATRPIGQLSGGQQQRVFLARALAQQGDIYLMDEPFAGIDYQTEKELMILFQALQKEGKTIIIVHHDLQTAPTYFQQVLLLNKTKVAFGLIEEVLDQKNIEQTYCCCKQKASA